MFIKDAIILAAGLGSRLGSMTADRPKALVSVWNEPLIVRLLRQLEVRGISQVVIVIGHMGERITSALGDRFGTISITYIAAQDFIRTNNIASLALVPEIDRPTVITDCDVLLSHLPAAWLSASEFSFAAPARALQDDEFGTVVRPRSLRSIEFRVLRRGEVCAPGWMKTLSLYMIYDGGMLKELVSRCRLAVAEGRVNLYYEDIISTMIDGRPCAILDADKEGVASFEIDTPADFAAAQASAAKSNDHLAVDHPARQVP